MKTTILVLTVISLTMTAFKTNRTELTPSEQAALKIVKAFQQASSKEYAALFPTLAEFHAIMDQNVSVYGANLAEAKAEFAKGYERHLLPAVEQAFNTTLQEGKAKGIAWDKVRLVSVDTKEDSNATWMPFTIVLATQEGKEFRLKIEKAFFLRGQWRVSQFISLN